MPEQTETLHDNRATNAPAKKAIALLHALLTGVSVCLAHDAARIVCRDSIWRVIFLALIAGLSTTKLANLRLDRRSYCSKAQIGKDAIIGRTLAMLSLSTRPSQRHLRMSADNLSRRKPTGFSATVGE